MSNYGENEIGDLFQSMISKGTGLLNAFDAEQAIQEKLITLIRDWINQALNIIEPSIPTQNFR